MGRAESKEQTREALLAAALERFAEDGIEGASLDAICAQAGRTRGAFYVHFRDREDLIRAVVERTLQEYLSALARVIEGGDLHAVIAAIAELLRSAPTSESTFLRVGTAHFHLLLGAGARYPSVGAQIHASHAQGTALLSVGRDDPGLAETLVAVLIGLLAFEPHDLGRLERIQATLDRLL